LASARPGRYWSISARAPFWSSVPRLVCSLRGVAPLWVAALPALPIGKMAGLSESFAALKRLLCSAQGRKGGVDARCRFPGPARPGHHDASPQVTLQSFASVGPTHRATTRSCRAERYWPAHSAEEVESSRFCLQEGVFRCSWAPHEDVRLGRFCCKGGVNDLQRNLHRNNPPFNP